MNAHLVYGLRSMKDEGYKYIGKSSSGLLPYYIVECMDETLPNETYQYKFVSLPLTEIFVK